MNAVIKVGFLILLASVVANAAPVQDDLVIAAAVDDASDGMHSSERRSSDVTRRIGLPWHLDRIDQRSSHLDGKYTPFANGKSIKYMHTTSNCIRMYVGSYSYSYFIGNQKYVNIG